MIDAPSLAMRKPSMDADELKKEAAKIQWWHTLDLGNGVVTTGVDDSSGKLKTLKMPEDLTGMSVLDVGAWDGFFSFEAERRGAKRVLATDWHCWGRSGYGTKAGFDFAKKVLSSKVEENEIDVLEISPERVGVFDLVLFLGVLYHMRHPLLALEKVASVTRKQLILETHTAMLFVKEPVMRFYPGNELNRDTTNWWGPNAAAVEAMLKDVGFKKVEIVSRMNFSEKLKRVKHFRKKGEGRSSFEVLQDDRVVFHAFK